MIRAASDSAPNRERSLQHAAVAALWPAGRFGEAMERFAQAIAAPIDHNHAAACFAGPVAGADDSIQALAGRMGLEAEPADVTFDALQGMLREGAPFVLRLETDHGPQYLFAIRSTWRGLELIRPDAPNIRVPARRLATTLGEASALAGRAGIERLLDAADVRGRRREGALHRLIAEQAAGRRCGTTWQFGRSPGGSFLRRLRDDGVVARVAAFVVLSIAAQAAWLGSWWVIGHAAWRGRLEGSAFAGWVLLLATYVALRTAAQLHQHVAATRASAALRQRLLTGALRLDPDAVRGRGVGQWFGVVLESQWIESTALDAAFTAVMALIEVASAGVLLAAGAGGVEHAALLGAWVLTITLMIVRFVARSHAWSNAHLRMSHDLVEKLVGHRTRVAQETREGWHREDDALLADYQARSRTMDRWNVALNAIGARGWLVVGSLGLVPAVLAGGIPGPRWAIAIAGVVLAFLALRRLTSSVAVAASTAVAWTHVGPLLRAGADDDDERVEDRDAIASDAIDPPATDGPIGEASLLEGRSVSYTYGDGPRVLDGCDVRLADGDRLLMTGASAAGKSTLIALLSGLRQPTSGRVLTRGLDLTLFSERSRRRLVAAAPQFHENHVLAGSLAFNLLLGRRWPPSREDRVEALTVCQELGLGPLLERMPGGLDQQVGETGWQLSHGERSRVYVARALLQEAPVVLLDESFGALDPESLAQGLGCVDRRARAALLVTHL